tara:strand:- start:1330 stop:1749 length:420 start_codon:yes stop_codon:yes gene_type:complete
MVVEAILPARADEKLTLALGVIKVAVSFGVQETKNTDAGGVWPMKKTVSMLGVLTVLAAEPAFARDDCFVPMSGWQPRAAVARLAEENGWQIRRIKIEDGCYQIYGLDSSGRRVEVKVHPATLDVIKLEYEGTEEKGKD